MKFDLLPKNNKSGADDKDADKERKIEFSQKLSAEDQEDLSPKAPVKKNGGGFNILPKKRPGEEGPKLEKVFPTPPSSLTTPEKKEPQKTSNGYQAKREGKPTPKPASDAEALTQKKKKKWGFSFNFFKKGLNKKKDKIIGADILDVNLVRDEIVKFFDWQKNILILIICIFSSLFIISFIYWGISFWGSRIDYIKDPYLVQNYYKLNREVRDLNDEIENILAFKKKLSIIEILLDKHIYWTNFFEFLEENTLSDVHFTRFSGGVGGSYTLSAYSNDFDAIDAQIKKFLANDNVNNAHVDSGVVSGSGEDGVTITFSLTFSLKPSLFVE